MTVAEKKYLEKWTFAEEQVYLFPLNIVFLIVFLLYLEICINFQCHIFDHRQLERTYLHLNKRVWVRTLLFPFKTKAQTWTTSLRTVAEC